MSMENRRLPSAEVKLGASFRRRHRDTIPELLFARQRLGVKPSHNPVLSGVRPSLLSSRAAWNPTRLQNMILAVGPGTPAGMIASRSIPISSDSDDDDSGSSSSSLDGDDDSDMAEDPMGRRPRNDPEEYSSSSSEDHNRIRGRSQWTTRSQDAPLARRDSDEGSSDDEEEGGANDFPRSQQRGVAESAILADWYARMDGGSDGENDGNESIDSDNSLFRSHEPVSAMKHGGCVNTAAWLDCGWRISLAGSSIGTTTFMSDDCPTQLVTSGDDYIVKFWDVREAMGSSSPMAGGNSTICPFSMDQVDIDEADDTVKAWKRHYCTTGRSPYGSLIPLATLDTGHSGNVFHVTPIVGQPGKVATTAADGFLRVSDLETGSSVAVCSPEYGEAHSGGRSSIFSFRSDMCFSHHFITRQVGLVCSERGLRRFDMRLPPREQNYGSIFGRTSRACKACTVWSTPSMDFSLEEAESSYVFAAGSSADVALCDLRMTGGSYSRLVQQYRPSGLSSADHVSVSGLDLSLDRRELLVSYESDQIYSFPVFPGVKSKSGPTMDQLDYMSKETEADHKEDKIISELTTYGAHLNRFTFLKNARYAGPNDEYICTGSDSGHAWIYERATGSVSSLLNADHSTCNGVVPHPVLPVFITYGIDSTAKLWRASTPVDSQVDDSAAGRRLFSRQRDYEMSPVVKKWGDVQQVLKLFESDEDCQEMDILPDSIPSTRDILTSIRHSRSIGSHTMKSIGNDLMNLPDILRQNVYACLRSIIEGDDVPVESPIEDFQHRVSLIRLRHQTDSLGLSFDPKLPWTFHKKESERYSGRDYAEIQPADFVPDHPSDWIPYDEDMCSKAWCFSKYFNTDKYEDHYEENYVRSESMGYFLHKTRSSFIQAPSDERSNDCGREGDACSAEISASECTTRARLVSSSEEEEEISMDHLYTVYQHLLETVQLLKEAGNEALRNGDCQTAARRYDKAIQYAAVASMSFPVHKIEFAKGRREVLKENGRLHLKWGPLAKTLVSCRLNMALLMLKPDFLYPELAIEQAKLAVRELKPFCMQKGKVMMGPKLNKVYTDDESDTTFKEGIPLLAKAYFRLGSAHLDLENFSDAMRSFEMSIEALEKIKLKPDRLLLRRLSEAKRQHKKHNERQRKKFKFAFGQDAEARSAAEEDD